VKISGYEKDVKDFTNMLEENNISFSIPSEGQKSTRRTPEGKEYDESMWHVERGEICRILDVLVCTVIVELTKETIKAIINWLKERRKKGLKKPQLKVAVEGNVLNLNQKDMKILASMLEKVSKEQKPKKRRCSK
jgi:hypothetical protein